jgi:hypothetical protein
MLKTTEQDWSFPPFADTSRTTDRRRLRGMRPPQQPSRGNARVALGLTHRVRGSTGRSRRFTAMGPGTSYVERAASSSMLAESSTPLQRRLCDASGNEASGRGSRSGRRQVARTERWRPATVWMRETSTEPLSKYADGTNAAGAPLLQAFLAMDIDERWLNRSPQVMLRTFHGFQGGRRANSIESCEAVSVPARTPSR